MIVLVAILVPIFFGIGAIVIDIGNWFVHKRHLQSQVDAAALAGGLSLYGCVSDTAAANANVAHQALAYVGDPTRHPSNAPIRWQENAQVQTPLNVHAVLNSTTYWTPGTATDGTGYDYTDVSSHPDAPRIGPPGTPCYNGYIDVKATDHDAPRLWGLLPFSTSPKAVARVELFEALTMRGVLPLGVTEVRPRWVAAIVVNEDAANW
ncbi:MAG: pilus assembly protein TadG-related protein, partial [Thermoleophilia bacterium]|nr:pilus assembly protein TadG-related protein [Thermoleophilia bacterium]